MDPTRRTLVGGLAGVAVLGCSGVRPSAAETRAGQDGDERGKWGQDRPRLFLPPERAEEGPDRFVASPAWLDSASSIYLPTPVTAGAASLCFADGDRSSLASLIDTFDALPDLHAEGRQLGTDVVYIVDFWEGRPGQAPKAMRWSKSDYRPRVGMGGAEALRRGTDAVRSAGGRTLLYVSGMNLDRDSPLGREHGEDWTLKSGGVPRKEPYAAEWMPCATVQGWQDHLVDIARRMGRDYGADGVHIDSWGNMRGFKCDDPDHPHDAGDGRAFDSGTVRTVERMRDAFREGRPDAVVLAEGPKLGQLFRTLDGCQCWGIHEIANSWLAGAVGQTNLFAAAWSLDDMHQILAWGHKWMLPRWWLSAPSGRCVEALERAIEAEKPGRSAKDRRYDGEAAYRVLHLWRNAGLVAGKAMPWIADATPRRWDEGAWFEDAASFETHMQRLKSLARELDQAWGGPAQRQAVPAHLAERARARSSLAAAFGRGTQVDVIESDNQSYIVRVFEAGGRRAMTAVNVSDSPIRVNVGGSWRALVGGRAQGSSVEVGAHDVGLFAPA